MISVDNERRREDQLRDRVAGLSVEQQRTFYRAIQPRLKDPDTYAVLNFVFLAGLHHFYLGRWVRGLLNLTVFLSGALLMVAGHWMAGIILVLAVTLVELPALFRSQCIVLKHNNDTAEAVLKSIH